MIPIIVYLHAHDSGRNLQPYGYPVATPHLQAFAEDAVMFRNAFAAAPGCSPSRSALLTGTYPHVNGVIGLAHRGFPLIQKQWHLAYQLREKGYRTVLCGMQHVWEGDQHLAGYTDDIRPKDLHAESVLPGAIAMLEQAVARDTPLFLDVGFEEAHRPYHTAAPGEADYAKPPFQFPDIPEIRQDTADMHASLRAFDDGAGALFAAMKRLGIYDNAFILVTTDHGLPMPAMKCSLGVYGTGVFLMLRGPEGSGFRGGHAIDAMVTHMDVLPTLYDIAGWQPPAWFAGRSLIPLLNGADTLHDEVFGEITFHATWEPTRSIRTCDWLLIRHIDAPRRRALSNVDEGPTRTALERLGWPWDVVFPEVELFDLTRDPAEQQNVAHSHDAQEARSALLARLQTWMVATDDPLVTGVWPISDAARMNRLDATSADDALIHPAEELDFAVLPPERR